MIRASQLLLAELATLGGVLGLSALLPSLGARAWRATLRRLDGIARRPALAIGACALAAAAGSAAVALLVQWPVPRVTDEFTYLLSADTFLQGRLANPPHPQWEHFETIHVLQQPTYAAKYPPGQGLLLALGWLVGGHPIVGVWLGAALLCGAITWMLYGWLPRRWAFVGGLVSVLQFGIATYWTQSYWGGVLPAAGGALAFGGLVRVVESRCLGAAALSALGFVLLALTRPYEGFVLALPAVGWLLVHGWRSVRLGAGRALLAPVAVLSVIVAAGLGWLALDDAAVTGDPLQMPYRLHDATYAVAPPFLWLAEYPTPVYRHEVMRDFYTRVQLDDYRAQQSLGGFLAGVRRKLATLWSFYAGPFLSLPLVALPWILRERRLWIALATLCLILLAVLCATFNFPHYAAPATGLCVLVGTAGLRRLSLWRPARRAVGASLAFLILAVTSGLTLAQATSRARDPDEWHLRRAAIVQELEGTPGRHLVLVRYGPAHTTTNEWVYNGADLSGARILFAHDMGEERNRPLIEHESDRLVWRLDEGFPGRPACLVRYSP